MMGTCRVKGWCDDVRCVDGCRAEQEQGRAIVEIVALLTRIATALERIAGKDWPTTMTGALRVEAEVVGGDGDVGAAL